MPSFDDPPSAFEEQARKDAEALDAWYADRAEQDALAALQERDEAIAELVAARAELEKMRDQRDALARYIELIADPMHAPSRPRQRPRFAGEDHDDYALRGE